MRMLDPTNRELNERLVYQEHRILSILSNIWAAHKSNDRRMLKLASKSLFWWFFGGPQFLVVSGGLITAFLLFRQNGLINISNQIARDAQEQARYFEESTEIDFELVLILEYLANASNYACAYNSDPQGNHSFSFYLEAASSEEQRLRDYLETTGRKREIPASTYHALADLGRHIWDFERIKRYCELAFESSTTVFARHDSLRYLACAHFDFHGISPEMGATLADGRKYFQMAIDELEKIGHPKRTAQEIGATYELWAGFEFYHGHKEEAIYKRDSALKSWKSLSSFEFQRNTTRLDALLKDVQSGLHPKSPCRIQLAATQTSSIASDKHAILQVPPLSQDSSLGKIVDGKRHMRFVEIVHEEGQPSIRTYQDGDQDQVAYMWFSLVYHELILDLDEALPEKRYVAMRDPTLAPALPSSAVQP